MWREELVKYPDLSKLEEEETDAGPTEQLLLLVRAFLVIIEVGFT